LCRQVDVVSHSSNPRFVSGCTPKDIRLRRPCRNETISEREAILRKAHGEAFVEQFFYDWESDPMQWKEYIRERCRQRPEKCHLVGEMRLQHVLRILKCRGTLEIYTAALYIRPDVVIFKVPATNRPHAARTVSRYFHKPAKVIGSRTVARWQDHIDGRVNGVFFLTEPANWDLGYMLFGRMALESWEWPGPTGAAFRSNGSRAQLRHCDRGNISITGETRASTPRHGQDFSWAQGYEQKWKLAMQHFSRIFAHPEYWSAAANRPLLASLSEYPSLAHLASVLVANGTLGDSVTSFQLAATRSGRYWR
jgi:hypothetical protein